MRGENSMRRKAKVGREGKKGFEGKEGGRGSEEVRTQHRGPDTFGARSGSPAAVCVVRGEGGCG